MKIKITKLRLLNFKGVRDLTISFNANGETNIYGDNATGKTTIFDAYLWLLFGKDSTDRKTFEIKTLDKDNKPFRRMEHEVSATFFIDGVETVLTKQFREKWVRKRGAKTEEFEGHENNFFWNGVPLKLNEYEAKIKDLVNEQTFKQVSNVVYFANLKWQDRREVLLKMASLPSDKALYTEYAAESNLPSAHIDAIITALNAGKTIPEYRKEVAGKRKNILDDKANIPARIDEAKRNIPEDVDYSLIEGRLQRKQKELADVEDTLFDKQKEFNAIKEKMDASFKTLRDLKDQANNLYMTHRDAVRNEAFNAGADLRDAQLVVKNVQQKIDFQRRSIERLKADLANNEAERNKLREEWGSINSKEIVFNESDFCCPTCKRDFPAEQVNEKKEEFTRNFNNNKKSNLEAIGARGKRLKDDADDMATQISQGEADLSMLEGELKSAEAKVTSLQASTTTVDEKAALDQRLDMDAAYQSLLAEIKSLDQSINTNTTPTLDTAEINNQRQAIKSEIADLQSQIAGKGMREKLAERLAELEGQEEKMAQELADLEGIEYAIAQFVKYKMNFLEEAINSKFSLVKFKLFEEQINGGETESCTILMNGVPYPDLNTASKIQAGVDIINALSKHYDLSAPIFIDNRESVVRLPHTENQIINLIVSPSDKKLRVETNEPAMELA